MKGRHFGKDVFVFGIQIGCFHWQDTKQIVPNNDEKDGRD